MMCYYNIFLKFYKQIKIHNISLFLRLKQAYEKFIKNLTNFLDSL